MKKKKEKLSILQKIGIIIIVLGAIIIIGAIPIVQQTNIKIPGVIETDMPQLSVNMLVVGSLLVILGGILWKTGRNR